MLGHHPFPSSSGYRPLRLVLSQWRATRRLAALALLPNLPRAVEDPEEEVYLRARELLAAGADPHVRVPVTHEMGKTSLVCLALAERQEWLLDAYISHKARPDHTLIHALVSWVSLPAGSSLVKGREVRSKIVRTTQGVSRLGERSARMLDTLLTNGFSPCTDWGYVRQGLERKVYDCTTMGHPSRPLGDIIQRLFPAFYDALQAMESAQQMERDLPAPARASPARAPRF